jgi:hypothetical protein
MPACRLCGKVQATAEVRRAKLGGLCKDKLACTRRRLSGGTPPLFDVSSRPGRRAA